MIFDNSLEHRSKVFNQYWYAREFFRRAHEFRDISQLETQKNDLADDQYRLRTLAKYFNTIKHSTGRLEYIQDQLIGIYDQSLTGKGFEGLKGNYLNKLASIPIFSPRQVYLSYLFVRAICPEGYLDESRWGYDCFFEIPAIFEIKRPKISLKANENLNISFIDRCFKGWKRRIDIKKAYFMKKHLEQKAISFIILKNYFVERSYRRHIVCEFKRNTFKKHMSDLFLSWRDVITSSKRLRLTYETYSQNKEYETKLGYFQKMMSIFLNF